MNVRRVFVANAFATASAEEPPPELGPRLCSFSCALREGLTHDQLRLCTSLRLAVGVAGTQVRESTLTANSGSILASSSAPRSALAMEEGQVMRTEPWLMSAARDVDVARRRRDIRCRMISVVAA
jgi:hypothetical protein